MEENTALLILMLVLTSPFWGPVLVSILLSIAAIVEAARGKK